MFEGRRGIPRCIGDESILVAEGPYLLVINISAIEAEIRQRFDCGSIWVKIGINSWNSSFVRSIKSGNWIPNFSLYFEIIFEVVDDCIILFSFSFIMILIKLACNIMSRIGILVWECRICFVIKNSIFFYESKIGFFLVLIEYAKGIVLGRSESTDNRCYLSSKHY